MALEVLNKFLMARGTIVFLGSPQVETGALVDLAPEFGWSLEIAAGLDALRELSAGGNLVAVLFDAHALGLPWKHALDLVRGAAAPALPIPCHRLSDRVNWPELAEAGAFHALALPFDRSEVRQSLGFVSVAGNRPAANVLSISSVERLAATENLERLGAAAENLDPPGTTTENLERPAGAVQCRCIGRCHCSVIRAAGSVA
jgi:hypothetical protein